MRTRTRRIKASWASLIILGIMAAVAATAALGASPRIESLLPQGINRVPSCEDPADVVAFNLKCDPNMGVGDQPGDEPLIPSDLPVVSQSAKP
jgi:hypothetical protein